jgi:hypothetical protein
VASKSSFVLRVAYAVCLVAGASTHLWTVITHGPFWDYGGAPVISRIYWTSLTVLDPMAAILLFARPRAGLVMTLAIIVSNVAHNTWVMLRSSAPDWMNWMYVSQVLFLVFVLATMWRAWHGLPARENSGGLLAAT